MIRYLNADAVGASITGGTKSVGATYTTHTITGTTQFVVAAA
jgi:hypothetical protein